MIKQMKIKGGRKKESESTYECNYEPEREREGERERAIVGRKRGEGGAEREQRCKRIIEGGPNGTHFYALPILAGRANGLRGAIQLWGSEEGEREK